LEEGRGGGMVFLGGGGVSQWKDVPLDFVVSMSNYARRLLMDLV